MAWRGIAWHGIVWHSLGVGQKSLKLLVPFRVTPQTESARDKSLCGSCRSCYGAEGGRMGSRGIAQSWGPRAGVHGLVLALWPQSRGGCECRSSEMPWRQLSRSHLLLFAKSLQGAEPHPRAGSEKSPLLSSRLRENQYFPERLKTRQWVGRGRSTPSSLAGKPVHPPL